MPAQPGILAPVPRAARHVTLRQRPGVDPRSALDRLATLTEGESLVVGVGPSLAACLSASIPGLRPFPALLGPGIDVPSTPAALWLWARADDAGLAIDAARRALVAVEDAFVATRTIDAFRYREGRDLTGYEDGTENPTGDAAQQAAIVANAGAGLDGGSFAALQQWTHDMTAYAALDAATQDASVGRRKADNEELADAPASAHVKRTAQESFEPPAFVVRRSMPWATAHGEGLVFLAFGATLDAFEAQMKRMTGYEDRISDALFRFTRPITGAYFWCPPVARGRLDLSRLLAPRAART